MTEAKIHSRIKADKMKNGGVYDDEEENKSGSFRSNSSSFNKKKTRGNSLNE